MVPDEFHDFFVATAGVAGALIGLLFVAISVVPEGVGESARAASRQRPASALSAFLNPLLIALFGLIPEIDMGHTVRVLSIIALVSMATLLVLLVREIRVLGLAAVGRPIVAVVGQSVLFVAELVAAQALLRHPEDRGPLIGIAVCMVILFALGIGRAWEYVGAGTPSLLGALRGPQRADGDAE